MKRTIGFVSVVLAMVQPLAHAQATPQSCLGAFVGMSFSLRNYEAYNNYFHNESKMQLAQAGVYTGPVAIEEYVKFANPENPAIETATTVNQSFSLTGIDADVCEFYLAQYTNYTFNELLGNGTLTVAAAFRLYLNITTAKFDRINVFYDLDYLLWFADMIAFPQFQAWVCDSMESGCPSTWSSNNLSSREDCISRLAALPTTTGDFGSYDGNSQACRALHGMLAGLNPEQHCPHISFAPQEDPNGAIKCQSSNNVQSSDLFTQEQETLFAVFKVENSVPAGGFRASIPCHSDDVVCPRDQVCVAGICADPEDTVDNQTNTTSDNSSMNVSENTSTTNSSEETDSDAAYSSMRMCTAVFLLIGAFGITPF